MSTSVTLPISGPWATAGFTQTYWSTMVSDWFHTGGVHGDWVIPGGGGPLQPYGDSSGMRVKVRAGQATWLGQFGELDVEALIDIASNASGNPRIDRVCLRRDSTAHTLTLTRIAGTPGVTPVAPAYTAQDMPICQVAVANGAVTIAAANVTDERPFFPVGVSPAGAPASYPSTPLAGQMIGAAGDGNTVMKFWDPTVPAWLSLVTGDDTGWVNLTLNTGGNWSVGATPRIRRIGAIVMLQGSVVATSSTPATHIATAIGAGFLPTAIHRYVSCGDVTNLIQLTVQASDASLVWNAAASGSIPSGTGIPLDTTWFVS